MVKKVALTGAVGHARRLRRDATIFERTLWNALRERLPQFGFRRQVPFGPYIADFASHRTRLIIELDGEQHAFHVEYDTARTDFLEREHYRVLRFWNTDLTENLDAITDSIYDACDPTLTQPSPIEGEG